jgi:zinc D-Ala-D-Ala carboxypeptidase
MLATSALLAPHFTAAELNVAGAGVPDPVVANARQVAAWLEAVRSILGVPVRVTSGYRTVAQNVAAGGATDSDHLVGLAADFEAVGLTPYAVYRDLMQAQRDGRLPPFDQLVYYVGDNHVHVGLGARYRGHILLKTTEGSYVALAGNLASRLRGFV